MVSHIGRIMTGSAESGNVLRIKRVVEPCYAVGLMYGKGLGVMKNDVLAYKWFNLAAAHAPLGSREYYLRIRDAVAAKLTAKQVAEAQWLASGFVPRR